MKEIELYTNNDKDILAWLSQFELPGKLDTAVIRGQAMAAFPYPDWMELILPGCFRQDLEQPWFDDISQDERARRIWTEELEWEFEQQFGILSRVAIEGAEFSGYISSDLTLEE